MTFHIKKLGVKIGIQIMQGLIALKKGLTFLLFICAWPLRFLGHILWACGGRSTTLLVLRILHALRLQKTFASRPIVALFIFLLTITAAYNFFSPRSRTSRATTQEGTDTVSATAPSPLRALALDPFAQFIEVLPMLPGEEENTLSIPTIAGGNALLAPSMNATRLENRLREEPEQYVVREGDTLGDIAEQFGISITTILWENKLTLRSIIRPGMELTILPVSGLSHVVQRRETIASIAKRYKVEERTVLDFNELGESGTIAIGQKLIIPEGEQPVTIVTPARPRISTARPPRITSPSGATPSGIRLLVPVIYKRISQWFTYRHSGIDMAGAYGTQVKAARDGIVVQSGWGTGYGLYVLIDHGGGLMTRYAHNSKNLVSRGESVAQNQTIALLGSTGRSTGPHVHFETIVNGRFVNPLRYIKL